MKCPTCRAVLSEGALACVPCLLKKSRDALLAQQENFVERLAAGKMDLRLSRQRPGSTAHLELLADPRPNQAYCGVALLPPQRRTRLTYTDAARPAICPGCLVVFDQIWIKVTIRQEQAAG